MLEYALKYAAHGWAIIPCRSGDKRPATQHGCLDATTDPEQIRAWWDEQPDLNIPWLVEKSAASPLSTSTRAAMAMNFWPPPLTITNPSTVYGNRKPAAAERTTSLPTATRPM